MLVFLVCRSGSNFKYLPKNCQTERLFQLSKCSQLLSIFQKITSALVFTEILLLNLHPSSNLSSWEQFVMKLHLRSTKSLVNKSHQHWTSWLPNNKEKQKFITIWNLIGLFKIHHKLIKTYLSLELKDFSSQKVKERLLHQLLPRLCHITILLLHQNYKHMFQTISLILLLALSWKQLDFMSGLSIHRYQLHSHSNLIQKIWIASSQALLLNMEMIYQLM